MNVLDLSYITRKMFAGWLAAAVNYGRCYDWAFYAYCMHPGAKLWTTDQHAWVEIDGMHYDSEVPRGTRRIERIPTNAATGPSHGYGPKQISATEFKRYWSKYGGGRRKHWNRMHEEMRNAGLEPLR